MSEGYRSNTYDPARERSWHLSLWCAPGSMAWCAHDRSTGSLVALHAGTGADLPAHAQLPSAPSSVSFVVLPVVSTLVPESALLPGRELEHLRLVHGTLPSGLLRDEPIGLLGARCIYLHDEQAEHRVVTRFPPARPLPRQAVLVQAAIARSSGGTAVVIARTDRRLDVALARDQRLLLSNTFPAIRPEDLLYYVLFAMEQCGVRPTECTVFLSGIAEGSEEHGLLLRYCGEMRPLTAPAGAPSEGWSWGALLEQFACTA